MSSASKFTFRLEGANFAKIFEGISKDVSNEIAGEATLQGGHVVKADAERRVQVLTGNTEEALAVKLLDPLPGSRTTLVGVERIKFPDDKRKSGYDEPAARAHFLEFGTVKSRPFPFLRPAMDTNRQSVLDVMTKIFRIGIKRSASENNKS